MGKILILFGMLVVAGLASLDRDASRRPASLGHLHLGEEGRQHAVARAFAWDDRLAYRAEYSIDGQQAELLVQLRRDRDDGGLGGTARVLELRRLSYGDYLERPRACVNALSGLITAGGELRLFRTLPMRFDDRTNADLLVGLPMRNEPSLGGTLHAWNAWNREYERVGTVRWTRLTHTQETQLENRIVKAWREAPGYLRSKRAGGCGDQQPKLVSLKH